MAIGIRRRKGPSHCCEQQSQLQRALDRKILHMSQAKLKGSASTSTILCAFAMESMVELQVNVPTKCPGWLFSMFAVCTTLLIALHILSLVISNFLLPSMDCAQSTRTPKGAKLAESTRCLVELAWIFSSLLGLFFFLVQVCLLCWVKFWDYTLAACWAGTLAMFPFIVAFVAFCLYFHRVLLEYGYQARMKQLQEVEELRARLEEESNGEQSILASSIEHGHSRLADVVAKTKVFSEVEQINRRCGRE